MLWLVWLLPQEPSGFYPASSADWLNNNITWYLICSTLPQIHRKTFFLFFLEQKVMGTIQVDCIKLLRKNRMMKAYKVIYAKGAWQILCRWGKWGPAKGRAPSGWRRICCFCLHLSLLLILLMTPWFSFEESARFSRQNTGHSLKFELQIQQQQQQK